MEPQPGIQEYTVITLYQPWAQLCVLPKPWNPEKGEKENETRSFPTRHKGFLLIHAGKKTEFLSYFFNKDNFLKRFKAHNITDENQLKLGAIIGVVEVVGSKQIVATVNSKSEHFYKREPPPNTSNEFAFGDWNYGRFAWEFKNPRLFKEPYFVNGSQGFWKINLDLTVALHNGSGETTSAEPQPVV